MKKIAGDLTLYTKYYTSGQLGMRARKATGGRGFVALDGLRGIAAALVVVFHFRSDSTVEGYVNYPFGDGYLAVDLFFCLSGFVLAHSYLPRFRGGMSFFEFLVARVIRLYPLYAMGLMLGAVVMAYQNHSREAVVALSTQIFMLPSMPPHGPLFVINDVSWSLFFELIVSIIFALTWRLLSIKNLILTVMASGICLYLVDINYGMLNVGVRWHTLPAGFVRTIFSFFLGLLIERCHGAGLLPTRLPTSIFILSALCLIATLLVPIPPPRALYDLCFVTLAVPTLVLVAISTKPSGVLLATCNFFGAASYALYTTHRPMIYLGIVLANHFTDLHRDLPLLACSLAYLFFFYGLSYALDIAYDAPFRRLLTGLKSV